MIEENNPYKPPESDLGYTKKPGFFLCLVAFLVYLFLNLIGITEIVRSILDLLEPFIGEYSPLNNTRMFLDLVFSTFILFVGVLVVCFIAKQKLFLIVSLVSFPIGVLLGASYLFGYEAFPMWYRIGCVLTGSLIPILFAFYIKIKWLPKLIS